MMSNLHELIPGAEHWPHFVRNRSEQFEARLVAARGAALAVALLRAAWKAAASRSRPRTAKAVPNSAMPRMRNAAQPLVALRFVDNRGKRDRALSVQLRTARRSGITGLTTPDGRFTILMPHPERVFRTVQMSWHPREWGEDAPWMRMFRNARAVARLTRLRARTDEGQRGHDDLTV